MQILESRYCRNVFIVGLMQYRPAVPERERYSSRDDRTTPENKEIVVDDHHPTSEIFQTLHGRSPFHQNEMTGKKMQRYYCAFAACSRDKSRCA